MRVSSFSPLFGVIGLIVFAFGGYLLAGGNLPIILEALPTEIMSIVLGALATTYILTSAGGPGTFKSIRLSFQGRQFGGGDYRALAAILTCELGADAPSVKTRSHLVLNDAAAAQMILDAKALIERHHISADQIGAILRSRIDAVLASPKSSVKVLQMLGRSLL